MNEIVNGIELYTISNVALEIYRSQAKHGKNASREIIERKLTSIILNSYEKNYMMKEKYSVHFGTFLMTVNEFTRKIEVVGWESDNHKSKPLSGFKYKQLVEIYKLLGLTKDGDRWLDDREDNRQKAC